MKNGGNKITKVSRWFNGFSGSVTYLTGRPGAFMVAFAVIVIWATTGPLFDYSDTWQLVINTGTTIITFLMVFVIQQSQNKDTRAVQLKLNELIACNEKASNRLVVVEDLTQEELEVLKNFYIRLSELARSEKDLHRSHSIDEATESHRRKHKKVAPPSETKE